jgi:Fructose-1-6-bisphosphatase, N-terminal domain
MSSTVLLARLFVARQRLVVVVFCLHHNMDTEKDVAVTLTQYILAQQHDFPEATGSFSTLLHAIEIASKYISSKVRCAGLFNLYGVEGTTNVQGEVVKKLDVISNNSMITALRRSRTVSLMVRSWRCCVFFVVCVCVCVLCVCMCGVLCVRVCANFVPRTWCVRGVLVWCVLVRVC